SGRGGSTAASIGPSSRRSIWRSRSRSSPRSSNDGSGSSNGAVTSRPARAEGGPCMEQAAITIDHFTKRYGAREAVPDLSPTVPAGSIFGLLGRNGAGKSTTIKTLLNLLQPTRGRLTVLGHDCVADSVAVRQRVGYVPEEPAYYSWMTVEEILGF